MGRFLHIMSTKSAFITLYTKTINDLLNLSFEKSDKIDIDLLAFILGRGKPRSHYVGFSCI